VFRLVHPIFEERLDCIAGLVPLGLRTSKNEISDVWVCDDIADNFLDADIGGLQSPGECGSRFHTGPDKPLYFWWDFFGIFFNENYREERVQYIRISFYIATSMYCLMEVIFRFMLSADGARMVLQEVNHV
jgi:hypothetical protein